MNTREELKLAKKLLAQVEKGWGKDKCEGYNPECANCKGQLLVGYLEWYIDFLEYAKEGDV